MNKIKKIEEIKYVKTKYGTYLLKSLKSESDFYKLLVDKLNELIKTVNLLSEAIKK